jgi:hypothetical protein
MHSGGPNDCNHLSNASEAVDTRDFSFKVPIKLVMKTGAGVLGFRRSRRRLPDARTGLKSGHGHHKSQQSDRLRRRSFLSL